jgi:hypothetical protein
MKRFVLTGTSGAGKTAIIRQLELDGFSVVEEAATDIIALAQARGIAEPWTHPSFIDSIADLQRKRLVRASRQPDEVQFHDRSAICTAALAVYLGHSVSTHFRASWSASRQRRSIKRASSLYGIWALSLRPKRAGLASSKPCVLNGYMKRPIATLALTSSPLNRGVLKIEWLQSRRQFNRSILGQNDHHRRVSVACQVHLSGR